MPEKIKIFFWGILGALGALIIESLIAIIFDSLQSGVFLKTSWLMPTGVLIEEMFSLALVGKFFLITRHKASFFSTALFFGLGFSLMEITFNILSSSSFSGNIFFSYLGLLLIHTATAGLFGYYFSKNNSGHFKFSGVLFFLSALLSHLAFNFSVLSDLSPWIVLGNPIFVLLLCFSANNYAIKDNFLPTRHI